MKKVELLNVKRSQNIVFFMDGFNFLINIDITCVAQDGQEGAPPTSKKKAKENKIISLAVIFDRRSRYAHWSGWFFGKPSASSDY